MTPDVTTLADDSNLLDGDTDAVAQFEPLGVDVTKFNFADTLVEKLDKLKYELENMLPEVAVSVAQIHKDLLASPELIHMLTPEQVNILVQGIDSRNDFTFAKSQETKVKTKAVKAVAKKESLADLLAQLGDSL